MRLLGIVLLLAGCAEPGWQVVTDSLDRVPLSVWAASSSQAFAVGGALGSGGEALFVELDGSEMKRMIPTGTDATLWWVHGLAPDDQWLVGERGTILHFDGTTLTPSSSGTDRTLYGVWGVSDDDLWAVGGTPNKAGILLHKDAAGWREVPAPVPFVAFFKVWGTASNDVFVCGEGGTILHFDGASWTAQPTGLPINTTLFTVAGRAPNDVYAVGGFGRGVALHYDGTRWGPIADPLLDSVGSLAGVSVAADGTLLIVGASGTKLRGLPGALVDETNRVPFVDLHAAFLLGPHAWTVGGNYLAPPPSRRQGVIATGPGGSGS